MSLGHSHRGALLNAVGEFHEMGDESRDGVSVEVERNLVVFEKKD